MTDIELLKSFFAMLTQQPISEWTVKFFIAWLFVRKTIKKSFSDINAQLATINKSVGDLSESISNIERSHADRILKLETDVSDIKKEKGLS